MIKASGLAPQDQPFLLPDNIWQLVTAGSFISKTEVFHLGEDWFMVRTSYAPERFFLRSEELPAHLSSTPVGYAPYVPRTPPPSDFDVDAFLSGLDL